MVFQGKSEIDLQRLKEREVEHFEEFYDEPVRWIIQTMKKEEPYLSDLARKYCADAQRVTYGEFFDNILGKERAREFLEREVEEVRHRLGLT